MGVWIKDIDVGKCYVTSTGQVRRVTKVEIKVTYESRGKKPSQKEGHGIHGQQPLREQNLRGMLIAKCHAITTQPMKAPI
jgi:hypothetical protein